MYKLTTVLRFDMSEDNEVTEIVTVKEKRTKGKRVKPNQESPVMGEGEDVNRLMKNRITKITGVGVSNLNIDELTIANQIAEFIENTDPKKEITADMGAKSQQSLFNAVKAAVNIDAVRFKNLFKWIIGVASNSRKNKGAFHDRYVMRFHSSMNLSPRNLSVFRSLINLICVSADVKNRKNVVKKVNINEIANHLKSQTASDNIIKYYYS